MAIPVYIGSTKVGEAEKPDDIVRIAREHGIRRFVVYAVTAHGEVPVSPSNWSDVVKDAEALRIVRKEIAGAGDAVQRALEELRGELSRVEEELRRLGDYKERLVKAIKALEELSAPAEASAQAETRAVSEEERAPASEEGAGTDLYVWEADDDEEEEEDWDDEEDWD